MRITCLAVSIFVIIMLLLVTPSARAVQLDQGEQILYSLIVVEIAAENLAELGITDIEYSPAEISGDSSVNLIFSSEALQYYHDEVKIHSRLNQENKQSVLLSAPQLMVVPGQTGRLYVAQEEILLETQTGITAITSALELIIVPRSNFNIENNQVLTLISLSTGTGSTGLETEAYVGSQEPYLLGVVKSSDSLIEAGKLRRKVSSKTRYFALYLMAQPAELVISPNLSIGNLSGLEMLFPEIEEPLAGGQIILIFTEDIISGFALAGRIRSDYGFKIDFSLNEVLSKKHSIALLGHIYDSFFLGGKLLYLDDKDFNLALTISDKIMLGPLILRAGWSPLVYNFNTGLADPHWQIEGELLLADRPLLGLGYSSLGQDEFAELILGLRVLELNDLMIGYKSNLQNEEKFWLGLKINF